ncbi:MAG: hypothetical protein AB7P52_02310 [Alphaproteobacteria bacterium]
MRVGSLLLLGMIVTAAGMPSAVAQKIDLSDTASLLAPGGHTIGGPGVFDFQPNQSINVAGLSGTADSICASVLVISGTVEISVLDAAGTTLETGIANATPGPGGLSAGATACADNVGLVEVKCSATSTEACKGAWRVDEK